MTAIDNGIHNSEQWSSDEELTSHQQFGNCGHRRESRDPINHLFPRDKNWVLAAGPCDVQSTIVKRSGVSTLPQTFQLKKVESTLLFPDVENISDQMEKDVWHGLNLLFKMCAFLMHSVRNHQVMMKS
ncbi:hypothetical protein TNCV_545791 [Trichonephila clavipes]|nr:hypothetical protein TNCV_545791 [Trichonephila clavipes]